MSLCYHQHRDSHFQPLIPMFLMNPIIGYQHNVSGNLCGGDDPDDVIGKATAVYVEARVEDVFVKFRQRQRGPDQYERRGDRGREFEVTEGGLRFGVNHASDMFRANPTRHNWQAWIHAHAAYRVALDAEEGRG